MSQTGSETHSVSDDNLSENSENAEDRNWVSLPEQQTEQSIWDRIIEQTVEENADRLREVCSSNPLRFRKEIPVCVSRE